MTDPTGLESQLSYFMIPRENSPSATGRQSAHGYGKSFVTTRARFLQKMFPSATYAPDASWGWNFTEIAETKGTGAIAGTSVHSGLQVDAYDDLFYVDDGTQVLNTIERQYNAAVMAGDEATIFSLKQKVIALDYYIGYLQMNPDLLPEGEPALAFNGSDYRIIDGFNLDNTAEVTAYLRTLTGDFTWDTVSNDKLFQGILKVVEQVSGDNLGFDFSDPGNVDTLQKALIGADPATLNLGDKSNEFARILFPDGESYLSAEQLGDMAMRRFATFRAANPDGSLDYNAYLDFINSSYGESIAKAAADIYQKLIDKNLFTSDELPSLDMDTALAALRNLNDPSATALAVEYESAVTTAVNSDAVLKAELQQDYQGKFAESFNAILREMSAFVVDDSGTLHLDKLYADLSPLLAKLSQADLTRFAANAAMLFAGIVEVDIKLNETGGVNADFLTWLGQSGLDLVVGAAVLSAGEAILSAIPGGQVILFAFGAISGLQAARQVANDVLTAKSPDGSLVYGADTIAHITAQAVVNAVDALTATAQEILEPILKELYQEVIKSDVAQAAITGLTNYINNVLSNIAFVSGNGVALAQPGQWLLGADNAFLLGTDQSDTLIETGFGKAWGGAGDDLLIGWEPTTLKAGQKIDPKDPNSAVATSDLHLTLDGGDGNDWIIVWGGNQAVTVGGLGRDWIYNSSKGGVIWGDIQNSTYDSSTGNYYYFLNGQKTYIADDKTNADNFVWSPDTTIMDAQRSDILTFFGIPLVGGNSSGGLALGTLAGGLVGVGIGLSQIFKNPIDTVYFDEFLPFITYSFKVDPDGGLDLYVSNIFSQIFSGLGQTAANRNAGTMEIKNFQLVGSYFATQQAGLDNEGTLNMVFKKANPIIDILSELPPDLLTFALEGGGPLVDEAETAAAAAIRFAQDLSWYVKAPGSDPLVLDLTGQGLVTTDVDGSSVYFDYNKTGFKVHTGWLSGDGGFLVLDNDNGVIGPDQLFGAGGDGFAQLAQYDSNHDGVINADDAIWSQLRVWVDSNQDGVAQDDELLTLGQLGIVSISLDDSATTGAAAGGGATLNSYSTFTFADGTVSNIFDVSFATDQTDTVYAGQTAPASWQTINQVGMKGFGLVTNLTTAMANDYGFANLVTTTAASMTAPDLNVLVQQVGPVLAGWGETQNQTQELTPVLLSADGTALIDQAVYVEDAQGGYWTLSSGSPVLDANGDVIARPTMQQVMQQATVNGDQWVLEQTWSPISRTSPVQFRADTPYLTKLVNGRAIVVDYGVQNADGSWRLASGNPVLDANGATIAAPTLADIMAQAAPFGQNWQLESFGYNSIPNIPVQQIGVDYVNNAVVDYTVQVTDQYGTFYVWARNLDYALQLQALTGASNGFNLRNYIVDFSKIQQVNAAIGSVDNVLLLTPGEFNFACQLDSITFQPSMLSASINAAGIVNYSVDGATQASVATSTTPSSIQDAISLLATIMPEYLTVSRAMAVRLAMQGGLQSFAQGIQYDAASDQYVATTDYQLAPMFQAILRGAPSNNDNHAIETYLANWNEILWQIYPDYQMSNPGNVGGATENLDQTFILQMTIAAFENVPVNLDLFAVANAFGVNTSEIVTDASAAAGAEVDGTGGTDLIYLSSGDHTYNGEGGSDFFFVGKNAGDDTIIDYGYQTSNELIFTGATASDVKAVREGEDLILTVIGTNTRIRVVDDFLGKLNPHFTDGTQQNSGMDDIVFADGTIWDRMTLAYQVANAPTPNQVVIGSGSADVLYAAPDDWLSGGYGGDIYVYSRGDGFNTIEVKGQDSFGAAQAPQNFVSFQGDITPDNIRFSRYNGNQSNDLLVTLLDSNGNPTGDQIRIVNEFAATIINLQALASEIGDSGLEYEAPDELQNFVFADGESLNFPQIAQKVIDDVEAAGGDQSIYGFATNDTIDPGVGVDDFLSGEAGTNTYVFGPCYGQDVIENNDPTVDFFGPPAPDVLQFTGGLTWADFVYTRTGDLDTVNLTMTIAGTNSSVAMPDMLKTDALGLTHPNLISVFEFGDGTTWDTATLLQEFINYAEQTPDKVILGYDGYGDTFDGYAGDETLEGGNGGDTYIFAAGYGSETILDSGGFGDQLILKGLASTDVSFSRTTLDLIITINATGESVTIKNQFVRDGEQQYAIENFVFTDKTINYLQYNPYYMHLQGSTGPITMVGSEFPETLDGGPGNDSLQGYSGGDTFIYNLGYGQDTIAEDQLEATWGDRPGTVIQPPYTDVQFGSGVTRQNVVFTAEGTDLLITFNGYSGSLLVKDQFTIVNGSLQTNFNHLVGQYDFYDNSTASPDYLTFNDVEEMLQLGASAFGHSGIYGLLNQPNVFSGGPDDTMYGGDAGNTYDFTSGDGLETIVGQPNVAGATNTIVFGSDVKESLLKLSRGGSDGLNLVIDIGDGSDVLTVVEGLGNSNINDYEFADGVTWTLADVEARMLRGTSGNDLIIGFPDQYDTLDGGAGNNVLQGGGGFDTYVYGKGYGEVSVTNTNGPGAIDFKADIQESDVTFSIVGQNLVATLTPTSNLVIVGGAGSTPVRDFYFENSGRPLTAAQSAAQLAEEADQAAQNLVDWTVLGVNYYGSTSAGNHEVLMGAGDTLIFHSGDGAQQLLSLSAGLNDTLLFADLKSTDATLVRSGVAGDDALITFDSTGDSVLIVGAFSGQQNATVEFADGVAWTPALLAQNAVKTIGVTLSLAQVEAEIGQKTQQASQSAVDLTLFGPDYIDDPTAGNHEVIMASGDTLVFHSGYGAEQAVATQWGLSDTVEFADLASTEATVTLANASGNDALISFGATGDSVLIYGAFDGQQNSSIVFSDGIVWTPSQLAQQVVQAQETSGNDVIVGPNIGATFVSSPGDDTMRGGGGSDTYKFARGDGNGVISDTGGVNTLDVTGYNLTDLKVAWLAPGENSLLLTFNGGADSLTLNYDGNLNGVSQVVFGDGTVTSAQLFAIARGEQGAPGNALVVGTSGPETFTLAPDDTIEGGGGADVYVFNRGDGQVTITTPWGQSPDGQGTLRFGAGISASDVVVSRNAAGDIILAIAGTQDRITLLPPAGAINPMLAQVVFADGTVRNFAQLANAIPAANGDNTIIAYSGGSTGVTGAQIFADAGDQVIQGGAGDDVLNAGLGQDTLIGGPGGDSYYIGLGDGQDTIVNNGGNSGEIDRIDFGPGITQADVSFEESGNDIVLLIGDGSQRVTIQDMRVNSARVVKQIQFSDGSSWNLDDILTRIYSGGSTNGNIAVLWPNYYGPATLEASATAETLSGGNEADTFIFNKGDGPLTIEDNNSSGQTDVLHFGAGLSASNLVVVQERNGDLLLRFKGSADQVLIKYAGNPGWVTINQVVFADGSSLSEQQLVAMAVSSSQAEDLLYPNSTPVIVSPPTGLVLKQALATSLTLVGSANLETDDAIQLTPAQGNQAGAAWGVVDLSHDVTWTAQLNFGSDPAGADGVSFSLQDNGLNALGDAGGDSLGALIGNSLGIAFDTYSNSGEPDSDFAEFTLNGQRDNQSFDPYHVLGNVEDGLWHNLVVTWNAATETMAFSLDGQAIASKTYDIIGNVFGGQSVVEFGFGGATGGAVNDQQVRLQSLTSTTTAFTVNRGAAAGTVVGYLQGMSAQIGESLTYTLVDANGVATSDPIFEIVNGDEITVKSGAVFDASDVSTHSLNVAVTDPAGDSLVVPVTVDYAGSATPAQSNYHFLDFAKNNNIQSNLIAQFPTGAFVADDAWATPFDITADANGANFNDAGGTLTINVGLADVTNVYTLINAYTPPIGDNLATVEFIGSNGADQIVTLVDGQQVRDFYQGGFANSINGITTQNAFTASNVEGAAGTGNVNTGANGSYVVDEQDFTLSSDFANQTLEKIVITDLGGGGTPILLGVTAQTGGGSTASAGGGGSSTQPTTQVGSNGDDSIVATGDQNTVYGGDGDDTIYGGGQDTLNGGPGDDIVYSHAIASTLTGGDVLDGGPGADTLYGGLGDDTYLFNRGDGDDVIYETGGQNKIAFGAGIAPTDISVVQVDGTDIELIVSGNGGSITIKNALLGQNSALIQQVQFADGADWSWAQLAALSMLSGSGDQTIRTIPNAADQVVLVSAGQPLYYQLGDGDKTVSFIDSFNNLVDFVGIASTSVSAVRMQQTASDAAFSRLVIKLADGSTVNLQDAVNNGVELQFSDRIVSAADFAQTVQGVNGAETDLSAPAPFSAFLLGVDESVTPHYFASAWDDQRTFTYRPGDGAVTLNLGDYDQDNTLDLSAYNSTDVSITRVNEPGGDTSLKSLLLTFRDGGSLLLNNEFDPVQWYNAHLAITSVVFSDVTVNAARLWAAPSQPAAGIGAVTSLTPLALNDYVLGVGESVTPHQFASIWDNATTFTYRRGDGAVTLNLGDYDQDNTLDLTAYTSDEVTLQRVSDPGGADTALNSILLTFSDGGSLLLNGEFDARTWGNSQPAISAIKFSDTTLSAEALWAAPSRPAAGTGAVTSLTPEYISDYVLGVGESVTPHQFASIWDSATTFTYRRGDGAVTLNLGDYDQDNTLDLTAYASDEVTLQRVSDPGGADTALNSLLLTFSDGGSLLLNGEFDSRAWGNSQPAISAIKFSDTTRSAEALWAAPSRPAAGTGAVTSLTPEYISDYVLGVRESVTPHQFASIWDSATTFTYRRGDGAVTLNLGDYDQDNTLDLTAYASDEVTLQRVSDPGGADTALNSLLLTFSDGGSLLLNGEFDSHTWGNSQPAIGAIKFSDTTLSAGALWAAPSRPSAESGAVTSLRPEYISDYVLGVGENLTPHQFASIWDNATTFTYRRGDGAVTLNLGDYDQDNTLDLTAYASDEVTLQRVINPGNISSLNSLLLNFSDGGSLLLNNEFDSSTWGNNRPAIGAIVFSDSTLNWTQIAATPTVAAVVSSQVVGSATYVSAEIDALAADQNLTSITLTDIGTPVLKLDAAQAANDQTLLSNDIQRAFQVQVTDTVANVLANISSLEADNQVKSIVIADTAANVAANQAQLNGIGQIVTYAQTTTVANYLANPTALDVDGGIVIEDVAANIVPNFDTLNSDARIVSVVLTDPQDPVLTLTAQQAAKEGAFLRKFAGQPYTIQVVDTAAGISANYDALNAMPIVTSIVVTDSAPVVLPFDQAVPVITSNTKLKFADGSTNLQMVDDADDRAVSTSAPGIAFRYAKADGNLSIDETAGTQQLIFSDLDASDLRFDHDGADGLLITVNSTGKTITVSGAFDASSALQSIAFADGSAWGEPLIAANTFYYAGDAAGKTISASDGAARLIAGSGDDTLNGASGPDTFVYSRTDGDTTIVDNESVALSNTLSLTDLDSNDVTLSRVNADLFVTVNASGHIVTVENEFESTDENGVQWLQFADGTIWDWDQIEANAAYEAGNAPQVLLQAPAGAATLVAGTGTDTLSGSSGPYVFVYASVDGDTTIHDDQRGANVTLANVLNLTDLNPSDVALSRVNNDLIVTVTATGHTVTVSDEFATTNQTGVQSLQFANGTVWNWSQIEAAAFYFAGNAAEVTLQAQSGPGTLVSGTGDDTFDVGTGPYTFVYGSADGDLTIDDSVAGAYATPANTLRLSDLNSNDVTFAWVNDDLIVTVHSTGNTITVSNEFAPSNQARVQNVQFANGTSWNFGQLQAATWSMGTDTLQAGAGNDTLIGGPGYDVLSAGPGSDLLEGGGGDNTYLFALGDGQATISGAQGYNKLIFGAGIAPDMVSLVPGVPDIILQINGTGSRVDLGAPSAIGAIAVGEVDFADGTVWSAAQFVVQSQTANSGDDVIYGDPGANRLTAGSGDDTIYGQGGDDTFVGASGDALFVGGQGADTYTFSRGDGEDTIEDAGGADTLRFDASISESDVTVRDSSNGANVILGVAGTSQTITIDNEYSAGFIENIVFADGTVWTPNDLLAHMGTSGADTIYGFVYNNNVLDGKGGDDVVVGGNWANTYMFSAGYGQLTIEDPCWSQYNTLDIVGYNQGQATLNRTGVNGQDLLITFANSSDRILVQDQFASWWHRVEQINFAADGTSLDYNDIGDDVIATQVDAGAQTILGTPFGQETIDLAPTVRSVFSQGANDTYIYHSGDGDVHIDPTAGGSNLLDLADYDAEDILTALRAGPNNNDLILTFTNTTDQVTIVDALGDDNSWRFTFGVQFADGTSWNLQQMRQQELGYVDNAGNNDVVGFNSPETMTGAPGNDSMVGGAAGTNYLFALGDGDDTVNDATSNVRDTITFSGIASTDVKVSRPYLGSTSVIFSYLNDTSDSVTVFDALSGSNVGAQSYQFADGVTWTNATLEQMLDDTPPVAVDVDNLTAVSGQEAILSAATILANDYDPSNNPFEVVSVDAGAYGQATVDANGDVVFTPDDDFTGLATIAYTISDNLGGFATAGLKVRVSPPATAVDDSGFSVAESGSLVIAAAQLLANDPDGQNMAVISVIDPVNGTVSLSSDGNITFTPGPYYRGPAQFTYVAVTPQGGVAQANVFITVTPVNHPPQAVDDGPFTTGEDQAFTLSASQLLGNDVDVDNNLLTIVGVTSTLDLNTTLNADGSVTVTPTDYYYGTDDFTYTISDPYGQTSTAKVQVSVTPRVVPPIANDVTFSTNNGGAILENNTIDIANSDILATDSDQSGGPITIVSVGNSYGGQATLLPNGTVQFVPWTDFSGPASFDYTITDGVSPQLSTATVTLDYQWVNQPPVATDDNYNSNNPSLDQLLTGQEDTPLAIPIAELLLNDHDIEDDAVNFVSAGGADHGTLSVSADGKDVIYTPDPNYYSNAQFSYEIQDPQGLSAAATVHLYFNPSATDAPPIANTVHLTGQEGVPMTIALSTILANDADANGTPLAVVGWSPYDENDFNTLHGTITFDADSNFVYTPNTYWNGESDFQYEIEDGLGHTAIGLVSINVTPVAHDPTVVPFTGFVTQRNIPIVMPVAQLMAGNYSVDYFDPITGDPIIPDPYLSFVGLDSVSNGTAAVETFDGAKYIVITPTPGYTGQMQVQYSIVDPTGREGSGYATGTVLSTFSGELDGSQDDDVLIGNDQNETIRGFEGNDYIQVGNGDDVIYAGNNIDTTPSAIGGGPIFNGVDTVVAGSGDDVVYAGFDRGSYNANVGQTGIVSLNGGNDIVHEGPGADSIYGGSGFTTVDYATSHTGVDANLTTRIGRAGDAQGDVFYNVSGLIGSGFADTLSAGLGDSLLEGGDGDDSLVGGPGSDTLLGGAGDDTIVAGSGLEYIDGGTGNNTIDYSKSTAGVDVDLATEVASGGYAGGDTLLNIENVIGSNYNDRLVAAASGSRLQAGGGDDTLIGGAADDTLVAGSGADVLDGGGGVNTIDFSGSHAAVDVNLTTGSVSGGVAGNDTISNVEVVIGSYFDDTLVGGAGDDTLYSGTGADFIVGGAGRTVADYAHSATAVYVNLATGLGSGGNAQGDTLTGIHDVVGSNYNDTLIGTSGDDTLQAGIGNGLLMGGGGSDTYVFGLGDGQDSIETDGGAGEVNTISFQRGVAEKDVSIIRQGDDLIVQLEKDVGYFPTTIDVQNQFLGADNGISQIAFADGTTWDLAQIYALEREGLFNAKDDTAYGAENQTTIIDPTTLFGNDVSGSAAGLSLVSVQNAVGGTVSITPDGKIAFADDHDYSGAGYFFYTVADQFGRQSTARVLMSIVPVAQPPVVIDHTGLTAYEDQVLKIPVSYLMQGAIDPQNETLTLVGGGPLVDSQGKSIMPYYSDEWEFDGTNLVWDIGKDGAPDGFVYINPAPDYYGYAGFQYTISNSSGVTTNGNVDLYVNPVNQPPRSHGNNYSIRSAETTPITVASLLASDYDIQGDSFSFVSASDPTNGTMTFDAASQAIDFTPDAVGPATFEYEVVDALGGTSTFTVNINVTNDPPVAANVGGFVTNEDQTLVIHPSELLSQDSDPYGDKLTLTGVGRFVQGGYVSIDADDDIVFAPRPITTGRRASSTRSATPEEIPRPERRRSTSFRWT